VHTAAVLSARRVKALLAIVASVALVVVFSGCAGLKPGSYSLSQQAGIGPVTMKFTLCTQTEPSKSSACGPVPTGEGTQAQLMVGLLVPPGASTPDSFAAVPAAGSPAITFTRSAEVAARMSTNAYDGPREVFGTPAGFEVAGYISETVNEVEGQAVEWTAEPSLGLPPAADGGSSGDPFKAIVASGWRNVVEPALPASRPIDCENAEGGNETSCGLILAEFEATLGVSDLKIKPPATTAVVPGQKVKLPFGLDFASSAAERPKFTLAVGSTLPGAGLGVSNKTFNRAPSDPATHRAPATTRKAIVQVPASARFGSYEVSFTATATQGGAVASSTRLLVKPKGQPKVKAPKKVKANLAYRRGIPVELFAPIAATRFRLVLQGPRPNGKGRVRLLKRVRRAKALGPIKLRLRLSRGRVEGLLAAGKPLRLEAKVNQPGASKPQRLVRTLKLR